MISAIRAFQQAREEEELPPGNDPAIHDKWSRFEAQTKQEFTKLLEDVKTSFEKLYGRTVTKTKKK